MQRIALLGLGLMGSGIAQNILKAGFPLTIYNRTKEKAQPLLAQGAHRPRSSSASSPTMLPRARCG